MRRTASQPTVSELESMSVQQEAVELERNSAHLSTELDGDAPWTIHGIAIGEGDVTRGQSGIRKKWPREALKPAADTLEGRPLVEDHDNSSRGVVGEVIAADYKDGVGVLYEAELYDEELAKRIKNGLLEVSIRGYHGDVEEMEETEEGAKLVQRVRFDNLSIVPSGAAPSNSAEMGPSTHLSAAECAAMMGAEPADAPEVENEAQLADISVGDYVKYDLMGETVHGQVTDTEGQMAFITLYWDSGGGWVNTEIPDAIPMGALQMWDFEEARDAEELSEHFNEGDLVMWEWSDGEAHGRVMNAFTEAGTEITRTIDGNEVTRTVEEGRAVYELEVWREDDEEFSGKALKYGDKLKKWSDPPEAAEMSSMFYDEDDLYVDSLQAHKEQLGSGYIPTLSVELLEGMTEEQLQDKIDEVYSEWNDHVNMSASELQQWSKNPCSREASVDPEAVIKRNLRLLEKDKDDWTKNDIQDAERTISFISRMSAEENKPESPKDGTNGCPTDWAISLLNWAYNPFDSIPNIPDDMDSLEPVELSAYDVPEGAEFEGNPSKYDEEDERYPEGEDTPQEDRQGMHEYEEEASDVAELADYSMHEPEWNGEHEGEWNRPSLEDFAEHYDFEAGTDFAELPEDTRRAIGNHFLIARGGFPAEDYGDLKLPVVEPNGELSLSALRTVKGGNGAQAVDGLSDDMEDKIISWVNETAEKVFGEDWDNEEENAELAKHHHKATAEKINDFLSKEGNSQETFISAFLEWADSETVRETVDEYLNKSEDNSVEDGVGALEDWLDSILENDDEAQASDSPADDADEPADAGDEAGEDDDTVTVLSADRSIPVVSDNEGTGNEPVTIVTEQDDNNGDTTMTDEITEAELEELRRKANAYDELQEDADGEDEVDTSEAVEELREEFQSDLEELKERTAILDEVDRSDVEALQEADEPYVMEREKYEELEDDVNTVRSLFAEALSEHTGVPAERIEDKWTLEEMREDLEAELDDDEELEDELTPDPQGADPDEEELEEAAEVESGSGDEPSEEAAEKQEEIRQRILG